MSKSLTYGLLLSILMVIAPHADHLPLWVSILCSALLSWRAYLTYTGNPLPKRWLLMLITVAGVASVVINFHTLFGREAGVTLLVLLAALKLMELRTARDAMVLVYLACFIIITNFFYSQSIPTALYLLATLLVIVTAWVHLQAQRIALTPRLRTAASPAADADPVHPVPSCARSAVGLATGCLCEQRAGRQNVSGQFQPFEFVGSGRISCQLQRQTAAP
jgi:protein-glutamine gamma-glutamyltransferase